MNTVSVLIVVDALATATSGDLSTNVYLIDTNKYAGSGSEGQEELKTAVHNLQAINWRVTGISPDNDVDITGFTGLMVDDKVCVPAATGTPTDPYWSATVQTQGDTGSYQYSVTLSIDGTSYSFDPYIVVS